MWTEKSLCPAIARHISREADVAFLPSSRDRRPRRRQSSACVSVVRLSALPLDTDGNQRAEQRAGQQSDAWIRGVDTTGLVRFERCISIKGIA